MFYPVINSYPPQVSRPYCMGVSYQIDVLDWFVTGGPTGETGGGNEGSTHTRRREARARSKCTHTHTHTHTHTDSIPGTYSFTPLVANR